jgi:hypothetical protein
VRSFDDYVLVAFGAFQVDQLIKDEDAKIQQLKAIIKIREQALLDRTKVELVWLEIQKKQLIETGKIEEASLLKKKQRGIILKHEQERNEIKKLKQMQKEASEQRKNTLKHQRNLIKMQLSTDNMLSKIAVKKPKERRSMGPLRVVQSCSESIHSETSISLKSSGIEDVLSITSRSVRVSESSDLSRRDKDKVPVSNVKRTLLMREAALQKRRKTAEELLRWHRKLLDEERKIAELEAAAKSVIKRAPAARDGPDRFDGRQLNLLWRSMTGSEERKFVEDKVYVMSQMGLERLCKSAMQYSSKNKRQHAKIGDPEHSAISEGERSTVRSASDDVNYSSVFEQDSVQEIITSQQEKTKISSISELIDNFTRIGDEISTLSKKSELGITSLKEVEDEPDKSSQSVVEITTPNQVESEETDQSEIKTSVEEEEEVVEDEPSVVEIVSSPKEDVEESTDEKDGEEVTTSNICTAIEDQEEPVWETLEKQISFSVEDQEESSAKRLDEAIVASIRDEEESVSSPAEDREESSVEDEEKSVSEKLTEKQISAETEDQEKVSASVEVEEKSISSVLVKDGEETDEQLATDETGKDVSSAAVEDEEETSCGKSDQQISTIEESDGSSSGKSSRDQVEDQKKATIQEVSAKSENLEGLVTEEISSVAPEDAAESSEKSSAEQIAGGESTSRSVEPITTDSKKQKTVESSSSVDLAKESLSLDEALESASKIEDSLSKLNEKLSSEKKDEEVETSRSESSTTEAEEKTPQKKSPNQIDVKKRVSEILADASLNRGDKSPRLQDLYVTTYDVGASNSPEFSEPFEEGRPLPTSIFGSEAEELRRKQLAIEQEIKQLELQQKEQLPYVFMREIPNKPPPPYTPPSSLTSLPQSILPTDVKEITEIASYSSKVLYKAHQNNNLDKVKFSENGFKLFSKVEVSKICAEYVFNVCRDVAREHYRQFETVAEPSWLVLAKRPQLAKAKPSDAASLERILNNKLKEVFGFKRVQVAESAIIKWGQKKRDHVDEVLVMESQEEESQWTNFDKDELIVKNQITNDIVKMLLDETAGVFAKILAKKKSVVG